MLRAVYKKIAGLLVGKTKKTESPQKAPKTGVVLTIGHSTREMKDFIGLLQSSGVKRLFDVRTVPRSRHNPQFNKDTLPGDLARAGIEYEHLQDLGGLRRTGPESVNTAWRNASFRGFADYMQTESFEKALEGLVKKASSDLSVIMCAEAVPWQCHRSLIADALVVRGIKVEHITGKGRRIPHAITTFARVRGDSITYPG